jgi:hypothetical protein
MASFCPVSGKAYTPHKSFCLLCRIALSKKLNVIDLDAILSLILAPPLLLILLQDCAMHIPALLAS